MIQHLRWRTLIGCLILGVTAPALAQDWALPTFEARYEGYVGQIPVGSAQLTVRREPDGTVIVASELVPDDILALLDAERALERSRLEFHDGELRPLESKVTRQRRSRTEVSIARFDWQSAKASVMEDGDSSVVSLEGPVFDPASLLLALITDAARGRLAEDYAVLDGRKIKRYEITRIAEQTMKTAQGPLHTIQFKSQRPGSRRSMMFWLAPALEHLPVQIVSTKDGDEQLRLEIDSVVDLETPAPVTSSAK